MASISHDPDTGRRTIQVVCPDGKRRSLRLGKVTDRHAQGVKLKVEDLAHAATMGDTPRRETAEWVRGLDDTFHAKLAALGLVQARASATLAAFIDDYTGTRSDVKAGTVVMFKRARRYLLEHFAEDRPLRSISPGDADRWRLYLHERHAKKGKRRKLSDNTIRRACGIAKQFFNAALRLKLVDENPFTDLPCSVVAVTDRYRFISGEDTQRVLDACPDDQWRLLFALARYGGLRVPSEALRMRWQDVDWEAGRFTVHSPKTEHHAGRATRQVPLFPELVPYLRESFELAEPGTEFCITRYRSSAVNLRTHLQRIIKRAGVEPWPKLWQNLRSTRETELVERFPVHVVTAWIGNTEKVANKHYLQVTDEHFSQAAGGKKAVQNPVQSVHAAASDEAQGKTDATPQAAGGAAVGSGVQLASVSGSRKSKKVGEAGFEPAKAYASGFTGWRG